MTRSVVAVVAGLTLFAVPPTALVPAAASSPQIIDSGRTAAATPDSGLLRNGESASVSATNVSRKRSTQTIIRGWPKRNLVVPKRGKLTRTVKVSAASNSAGRAVLGQRKKRGQWETRALGATSASGRFPVKLRARHKPVQYRVKVKATPQAQGARSKSVAVVGLGKPARAKHARLVAEINAVRAMGARCGGARYRPAEPLRPKTSLLRAAQQHATGMAKRNFFSHGGGSTPWGRAAEMGFRGALAENIAAGRSTAKSTVRAWVRSPGHCRNLMSARYNKIGVGYDYVRSSRWGHYWVMVVGR